MEAENLAGVNLTHLFAADVILPVQVIHPPPDRWLQRLCLAILEDALNCLEIRAVRGGLIARARSWTTATLLACFVGKISAKNGGTFKTEEEARRTGYRKAENCP